MRVSATHAPTCARPDARADLVVGAVLVTDVDLGTHLLEVPIEDRDVRPSSKTLSAFEREGILSTTTRRAFTLD